MRVIPMACVSFGTYEIVHAWLARLDQPQPANLSASHSLMPYCTTLLEADQQLVQNSAAAAEPSTQDPL